MLCWPLWRGGCTGIRLKRQFCFPLLLVCWWLPPFTPGYLGTQRTGPMSKINTLISSFIPWKEILQLSSAWLSPIPWACEHKDMSTWLMQSQLVSPVLCIITACGLPEQLAINFALGKAGTLHIRDLSMASFAAFFHISVNMDIESRVSLSASESIMFSSCPGLNSTYVHRCLTCCNSSPSCNGSCPVCCKLNLLLMVGALCVAPSEGRWPNLARYRSCSLLLDFTHSLALYPISQ